MPKCNQSNFNHELYNLNRARAKSGDKKENAIKHAVMLRKREQAEGKTAWIKMATYKSEAKLKKYQITEQMIQDAMHKESSLAV